jgi:hypothetical protein
VELTQLWPLAQTLPQAPQLFVLLVRLVSQPLLARPSQLPKPALQVIPQAVPLHDGVPFTLEHTLPQVPQFCVLFRLTQAPLQFPKPALHDATVQVPPVQAAVPFVTLQILPQVPQLFVLLVRLVSQPLLAMPSQLPKPALHEAIVHTPLTQAAVPLAELQVVPQVPQLPGSVAVFTQVPLQLVWPAPHVVVVAHTPLTQLWPLAQAFPHVPQLFGSVASFTQVPPQLVCPAAQLLLGLQVPPITVELHAQPPPLQTGVQVPEVPPFCTQLQTLPQAPQFLGSLLVFVQVLPHNVLGELQLPPQLPPVQDVPMEQAVPQDPQLEGSEVRVVQNPAHEVPAQLSVSPVACILYSTSRLASAPVLLAQVEPVRTEACSAAPAEKVMTMGPVSDQNCPGANTRSWPLVPSVKRNTAAGQVDPVGVFAVAAMRNTVMG